MNEIGLSLDTVWMLLAAMLVFWMQPGFALCDCSSSSASALCSEAMRSVVLLAHPTGVT